MEAMTSIHFSHHHHHLHNHNHRHNHHNNHHHSSLLHSSSSSSIHFCISNSTLNFPLKSQFYPSKITTFVLHSSAESLALQEQVVVEEEEQQQQQEVSVDKSSENKPQKRKLFVYNFPWTLSSDDLRKVFSECGTVKECEIIRSRDGKFRGFAFITMSSGDEAQAVVDKFNSKDLGGRAIKVEFAKRLRKPRPQPPVELPVTETRHKIYVSNLQWKVRSSALREFFSDGFNPVSARVVFESPNGRSAGYGFVSFNTREEAEAAIASLNGKELLGRPVILKFSERSTDGDAENKDVEEEKESQDESVSPVVVEEQAEAEISNAEISEAELKS